MCKMENMNNNLSRSVAAVQVVRDTTCKFYRLCRASFSCWHRAKPPKNV